jgi:hypothetical protein
MVCFCNAFLSQEVNISACLSRLKAPPLWIFFHSQILYNNLSHCFPIYIQFLKLANKGVYSAVLLDISQTFDRVWHRGLLHKLRPVLSDHFYPLQKSYLTNRHFRVKHEDPYSELKLIKAGVPQGGVLGQVLHLLYINGVPTALNSTMATSADDTAVVAVGETVENSTRTL